MNTKKITLAVSSFSGGGAERVMVTLANKFFDWGYEVDVIVGLDKGPYKKMLNSKINKIVLTDPESGKVKKIIQAFLRLRKYLSSSDSTVLMTTIRDFNVFISIVYFFSNSKIRLILREADTLDRVFETYSFKDKVLLKLMRFFYPRANALIANCNITMLDLYQNINLRNESVKVIYNPLDIKLIKANTENSSLTKQKKIISCGRLNNKKNFPDLIRAIPLVMKKYPNLLLEILGEGQERENLQSLIEELNLVDNVKLIGFVDNPYAYYSQADVFVQTSLWEGFGYVLAEAMACGTPVVAYDSKGAMREILADGKYGMLTPVGDLQALADAIIQKIENPTPQEVLREAVERFDVDKTARQYLGAMGVI